MVLKSIQKCFDFLFHQCHANYQHLYKQGEVVSICDENEIELARGMVNYTSEECKKIAGAHSDEILKILGYKNYDAVITRDNITNLV